MARKTKDALTPFHEAFALAYAGSGLDGKRAYLSLRPRVKETTAEVEASKLLRIPKVFTEIQRVVREALAHEHMTAEEVIARLSRIARLDPALLDDEAGVPLDLCKLPKAIRELLIVETERSRRGTKRTIRMPDKLAAFTLLMRYHKLLTDRVDVRHHYSLEDIIGGAAEEEGGGDAQRKPRGGK